MIDQRPRNSYLYALDVPSEKCAMDWRNVHFTAACRAGALCRRRRRCSRLKRARCTIPQHRTGVAQRTPALRQQPQRRGSQIKPLMHMVKTFPSFLPNEKTSTPHHLPFKCCRFNLLSGTTSIFLLRSHHHHRYGNRWDLSKKIEVVPVRRLNRQH